MSHDPQNPISNETGEYLPEVANRVTEEQLKAQDDLNAEKAEAEGKQVTYKVKTSRKPKN